jgi:hypothetical protein
MRGAAVGIIGAGTLLALVLAVYAPATRGSFIYDDQRLVVQEIVPASAGDFARAFTERHWHNLPYYRPITRITTLVQKALHGNDPAPFHRFNVLLMGAIALLVYAILRLPTLRVSPAPAWLGAAIFALHPIASSCVYPISSGRETLVPAFFSLLSIYAFLRPGRGWQAVAIGGLAFALFSQERAIVLPAAFVLADLLGLTADGPRRDPRRWLVRYLPVAAVTVGYLAIRLQLFQGEGQFRLAVLHHPLGPLLSVVYAIQTIFAPFRELAYEARVPVWATPGRTIAWLFAVALLAVVARRHWQRVRAVVLFWLGWAVLALLPTGNVLAQEAQFAERYVFVSLLGAVGIVATLASIGWDRPRVGRAIAVAGIAFLLACGWVSHERAEFFLDNEVFFSQWARSDPGSAQALFNLGDYFASVDDLDAAVENYRRAAEIEPDRAEIHLHLSFALSRQGRGREAVRHRFRALELDPGLAFKDDP